jgi:xanthine permease XanP
MKRNRIGVAVDEAPAFHVILVLALTHVLLIFDGIIFVPNVLGKSAGIGGDTLHFITFGTLVVSAVFTFLQSRTRSGIGSGYILFTGSYSAFLLCSVDAVKMGGLPLMAAMALLTAPVIFLYTFFIRFLRHIITPAVGGVVILLVAVSLVHIGLELWVGAGGLELVENGARLITGAATVLSLTLLMLFGTPRIRLWSPMMAMACGYGAALMTGQLHFAHTVQAPWFGLPPLAAWPGIDFNLGGMHLPLLFAFAMAMLASAIENTGNIMLVQQVSNRQFRRVSYDQVQGGLYCDGLSKVAAALLGTAVPSTYCDNLPLIETTGVASRKIGVYGAAILLVLAFMPKVSGVVLDMPGPVIGGFLIVMAAMLFNAGFSLVAATRLSNQHGLILGLSLAVGLVAEAGSFFPEMMPASLGPLVENSIAIGGFTAFALSTMARVAPKPSITGVFRATAAELPDVQALLESGKKRLQLDRNRFNALSLCCEEIFCHMVAGNREDKDRSLTLRVSRTEEGYFTEMVCGHKMDDINNFVVPESFFQATAEELDQLGLILFSKFAHDVKHIEISGYSYISFFV